jgi:glycine cleavage system H protein
MSQFKVDAQARYAKSHEWARMEDGVVVVGISDYAQDTLSDVVYVELPAEGSEVSAGKQAAVVESVKAAEDVMSPVSGKIVANNSQLADTPEIVNGDPYGAWFYKVEAGAATEAEMAALMDADAYAKYVAESAH